MSQCQTCVPRRPRMGRIPWIDGDEQNRRDARTYILHLERENDRLRAELEFRDQQVQSVRRVMAREMNK